MATTFDTYRDDTWSTLAAPHQPGETFLRVMKIDQFVGRVPTTVTCHLGAAPFSEQVLCKFKVTGLDVPNKRLLIGAAVEGYTDKAMLAGTRITARPTGSMYDAHSAAINALESSDSGTVAQDLADHEADHDNPHEVTAAQVGLANVDNTSDADKPISTAVASALSGKAPTVHTHSQADVTGLQASLEGKAPVVHTHVIGDVTGLQGALDAKATSTALATHASDTANPHQTTKAQVGLANVDNTSDASKPVSTATQAALDGKAPTVHTHSQSDVTGLTAALASKANATTVTTHIADTSNPHNVSKAQVGLGAVDNTADADKPISTAVASALSGKASVSHTHSIGDVTGLQTALDDKAASTHTHTIGDVTGLQTALEGKATAADLTSHTSNTSNPHSVTAAQVGLGNVSNTSDADKPVSTAVASALDGKANASHTHQASDITSGTISTDRLGTGTADGTTYLRGDGQWSAVDMGDELAIGSPVTDGTPSQILYVDASGNLGQTVDVIANSFSAQRGRTGSEHFGLGATSPASGSGCNTAIGWGAQAGSYNTTNTFAENTCIGYLARSGHNTNTLVGARATATLGNNTITGCGNTSHTFYATIIGDGSETFDNGLGSIGSGNFVYHSNSFCIGWGQQTQRAGEYVFGSRRVAASAASLRLTGATIQFYDCTLFGIETDWVDVTDATRKAGASIYAYDYAGKREAIRIEADGSAARVGFFGADAVAKPVITGSWSDGTAAQSVAAALVTLGLATDNTTP